MSNEKIERKPGFFHRIGRFFKDLRGETKKIVWPSKQQLLNNTLVVVVMIVVMSLFIWLLDLIFGGAVRLVLGI